MSLSNIIPIHDGQQKGNTLVPWLFNFASKYDISNIQNEQGIETKWDTSASGLWWCQFYQIKSQIGTLSILYSCGTFV